MTEIHRVSPFQISDAGDLQQLVDAIVNVLGISDDTQAWALVAKILAGNSDVQVSKDGSGNMVLRDLVAGQKLLNDLATGQQASTPLYLGRGAFSSTATGSATANRLYLRPVELHGPATVTDIAIWVATTSADDLRAGVYSETGQLLRATATVANSVSGLRKVALSSSLSLTRGRFWIALCVSGASGVFRLDAHPLQYCKYINQGSFGLPSSITIPSGSQLQALGAFGVVTGGIY